MIGLRRTHCLGVRVTRGITQKLRDKIHIRIYQIRNVNSIPPCTIHTGVFKSHNPTSAAIGVKVKNNALTAIRCRVQVADVITLS